MDKVNLSKEELWGMLNEERNNDMVKNEFITNTMKILIEDSPHYDRILKIQNQLLIMKFKMGELSKKS